MRFVHPLLYSLERRLISSYIVDFIGTVNTCRPPPFLTVGSSINYSFNLPLFGCLLNYKREQLKGGAFKGVLGAAQEAIVISPWVAIAVRPKPGVWEYLRVDVSKLAVEELSVSEYLQFKEQLVEGSTIVGSSKPCELRPPMSAFMCGSFISRPHNMELIAIFDPVHLEAGAP